MLNTHTCSCMCCKKKYNVDNLDKHTCMKN